jgi:sulfhydrogenase subunit gamma (sulfur reductase)
MSLYQPHKVKIEEIVDETIDTRTLRLAFADKGIADGFDFKAGQFGEYSVFGWGESTFCIASSPTRKGYIECTFKAVGKATKAMRQLQVGDTMGFRGPYGNSFPLDRMAGKSIVFIAGGIGLAPVRSVIWNALDLRDRFKNITIIYGARSVGDLVYQRELAEWGARADVKLWQTVDPGGETPDWKGEIAVVCGPPIMIKFTLPVLEKLGFAPENVYTTLENRMKCGVGKCGRCNVGPVYVCKDGPVFSAAELAQLPAEY